MTDGVGGDAKSPFFTRFISANNGKTNILVLDIMGTDLTLEILHGDKDSCLQFGGIYSPGQTIMPFPQKNNSTPLSTGPHFHFQIGNGSRFYNPFTMQPSNKFFQYSMDG